MLPFYSTWTFFSREYQLQVLGKAYRNLVNDQRESTDKEKKIVPLISTEKQQNLLETSAGRYVEARVLSGLEETFL